MYETEIRWTEKFSGPGNMYPLAQNGESLIKYFTFFENCPHILIDIFSSCTRVPIPIICV